MKSIKPSLKDLGWANAWVKTPKEVKRCKHKVEDIDEGPPMRGLQHHVICRICKYEYYYDSSD